MNLLLSALLLQTPSSFLEHDGAAYVPSPTYFVAPASADMRMKWSWNGKQLAFVSYASTEGPVRLERKLASGEKPASLTRLLVWNKESGRPQTVLSSTDPTEGVDQFEFMGEDLVYTTFSGGVGSTKTRLWLWRDGYEPAEVPLGSASVEGARFAAAKKSNSLLISTGKELWLMQSTRSRRLQAPGYSSFLIRGVSPDDEALVWAGDDKDGQPVYLQVDLASGEVSRPDLLPELPDPASDRPFVLDVYKLTPTKASLLDEDPFASTVPGKPFPLMEEDGGYRLDLVELGDVRAQSGTSNLIPAQPKWPEGLRRLTFINEMAKISRSVRRRPFLRVRFEWLAPGQVDGQSRYQGIEGTPEKRSIGTVCATREMAVTPAYAIANRHLAFP